jgi:hypothetical protein
LVQTIEDRGHVPNFGEFGTCPPFNQAAQPRRGILGHSERIVIALYHDQGLIAFKVAAFGTGVNVTLGLPFIRSSPAMARPSISPEKIWPIPGA